MFFRVFALLAATLTVASTAANQSFDFVIVGAGMSGAAAAATLKKAGKGSVVVLEANPDRVGGRLYSKQVGAYTVNLGASWIHGIRGNPLVSLARQAGVPLSRSTTDYDDSKTYYGSGTPVPPKEESRYDATWTEFEAYLEKRQDKADYDYEDDPGLGPVVDDFVKKKKLTGANRDAFYFNVKVNIEDEYGARYNQMSLWFDEDKELPGGDRVVLGPYDKLVSYLLRGIDVRLGSSVRKIDYSAPTLTVTTSKATFTAKKAVIVTVPLGVLKAGSIKFVPALPRTNRAAITALGMGLLNKCVLLFDRAWWDDAEWIEQITNRGFQATFNLKPVSGEPILYGFNSAKNAQDIESWSDMKTCDAMMEALRSMYPDKAETYRDCVVTRWGSDALSKGSYSFTTPKMEYKPAHEGVGAPVDGGRVLFAGEATSTRWPATAHGAYSSGVSVAKKLLSRKSTY